MLLAEAMATIEGSRQTVRARLIGGLESTTENRPATQQPPGNFRESNDSSAGFHHSGCRRRHEGLIGIFALCFDLRRHAAEAILRAVCTSQRHIGDRSRDTAIAILKGMNGNDTEMCDPSLEHGILG